MEEIILDGNKIKYKLDIGKIKNLYIQIKNNEVIVKAPRHVSKSRIQKFIIEKEKWILKVLEKQKNMEKNISKEYINGEEFFYKGEKYILNIKYGNKNEKIADIYGNELTVRIKENQEDEKKQIEKQIDNFYFQMAEIELSESMERLTKLMNVMPESFRVKRLKRVWGNCSSKKVISLNYNLIKYSKKAMDYVVIHELSHLKHMNHSKDFWNMVGRYMSDYKIAEKELKNT